MVESHRDAISNGRNRVMALITVALLSSYDTFFAEKVEVLDDHASRWRKRGVNVSQQVFVGVELETGRRSGGR